MAIRNSISNNAVAADENVSIGRVNLNDHRGTVDPSKNPYPGSAFDRMGVPQENARAIAMGLAFAKPDGLGTPKELPVQDMLAFVRMMSNPGWGAEVRYRERVRSPLTGLRGFCVVTCKSGSAKDVTECGEVSCPLWAMRLGKNGHYGKKS